MLSDQKKIFTKNNIDKLLNELSKEYKKLGGRNMPVDLIIVGGAAIIENYGFRDSTKDIDAIIPAISIMNEAINNTEIKLDLPRGWINNDFTKTSSFSQKLVLYSKFYKCFNQVLNARYITGEYLIAMKLKSGRYYKNDLSDIIGILKEHENNNSPISYEDISKSITDLYGDWSGIKKSNIEFLNNVLKQKNYDDLYKKARSKEIDTRNFILEFQEKYPNALNNNNIDTIIENQDKNNLYDHFSIRDILIRLKEANNI